MPSRVFLRRSLASGLFALFGSLAALGLPSAALAQQQANREIGQTRESRAEERPSERKFHELDERDRVVGEIWGLSTEEMQRVKVLMQGPRGAFSVPNISPIEVLGIHARSDAERRKYAESFARAFHQDVERSIVWNKAFEEANARLFPNEPMVDFRGLPKVAAPVGAADLLNVPRTQLIDTPPAALSAPSPLSSPATRVPTANRR